MYVFTCQCHMKVKEKEEKKKNLTCFTAFYLIVLQPTNYGTLFELQTVIKAKLSNDYEVGHNMTKNFEGNLNQN